MAALLPGGEAPRFASSAETRRFLYEGNLDTFALGGNPAERGRPLRQGEIVFEYPVRRVGDVGPRGARYLVTGPREPFPAGHYTAHFDLAASASTPPAPIPAIDVVARRSKRVFATRPLRGADFAAPDQAQTFSLPFDLSEDENDLEARVYFHNTSKLVVERIRIEPTMVEVYVRAGLAVPRDRRHQGPQ